MTSKEGPHNHTHFTRSSLKRKPISVDKGNNLSSLAEDPQSQQNERKRVSVKDFAILATMATLLASGLVTMVFGYDNLVEKCVTLELTYVVGMLVLFASVISILTYILLRIAAHYLVYVGIGVLLAILYPCHPSRVRGYLQRFFDRSKQRS